MIEARAVLAYGRSRGLWLVALGAGPIVVLGCAFAPRTVPLLLSDGDQRLRLPMVIGLIVTIAFGPTLARGLSEAEWVFRVRLRRARIVHLGVAVIVSMAVALAVAGAVVPDRLAVEVLANTLALLGVCLISVSLSPLPPWTIALVLVAITYVVGSNPDTGRPYPWAWLLWADHTVLKVGLDLALFAVGAVLFTLRPGRVSAVAD